MASTIIAAIAKNRVIGNKGDLPWGGKEFSEDMKRFRDLTMGHPIVMGRKTFESIGKPLDGRTNIVITRNPDTLQNSKVTAVSDLERAIKMANCMDNQNYIIGGAEIYKQTIEMLYITQLEITKIKKDYEGDVFFPEIDQSKWKEVSKIVREHYDFVTYQRK